MLARKNRLTADKDITRVLRKGRAVFTNLVGVRAIPNDFRIIRVAVVVSTKVHKRATERNLIKRRLRTALNSLIFKTKTGVDVVVMAQNESVGRKQVDLGVALEHCFKKLGLLS